MKGFKVSDETLSQRKGIACKNLQELKDKIHQKFSYKSDGDSSGNYKIYTEDGTEIDDDEYLMNLPSNTLLIVSRWGKNQNILTKLQGAFTLRNGFKIARKFGAGKQTAENIFDEILSLMRWGGGTEAVYQEVLKLMQEDFQSKWNQMMENVVDNTDGINIDGRCVGNIISLFFL